LNSAPWQPTLLPQTNPSAYSNRFGASIAGTPYIPGLTKPNTKQFVFINFTGQKNLNAYAPLPVRVPTLLERTGDFSQSEQVTNGNAAPVTIYNPATGQPYAGDKLTSISPQAQALLNYYPAPNIVTSDPTAYNYQTISNAGTNNVAINTRYVRTLGGATNTPEAEVVVAAVDATVTTMHHLLCGKTSTSATTTRTLQAISGTSFCHWVVRRRAMATD